jgi:hypothetical protein
LHDILEDTECSEDLLRATVGNTVTEIVKACTHEPSEDKTPEGWKKRKQHYLDHLLDPKRESKANLVALCDKVHNCECTVRDWHASGHDRSKMFVGFNAGWDLQLWWYNSLADAFDQLDVPADLRTRFRTAVTTVFGGTQ